MNDFDGKKKEKKDRELRMALWMCVGMGVGVIIGRYVLNSPFIGLSCGLVLGLLFGSAREKSRDSKK